MHRINGKHFHRYLGGGILEAGSDTTAVFIQSFIAMMVNYPEVLKRAQREIDEVIGSSRSPVLEDFELLLYLQAIIKEVCHWLEIPCLLASELRFRDYRCIVSVPLHRPPSHMSLSLTKEYVHSSPFDHVKLMPFLDR